MLSEKRDAPHSATLSWIHCRFGFDFLRSSIMCIIGAGSSTFNSASEGIQEAIDFQLAEGHVHWNALP